MRGDEKMSEESHRKEELISERHRYFLTYNERRRLDRAAYNISSVLIGRLTLKGGDFWMEVSEDLRLMAQQGVSCPIGGAKAPTPTWVRVLDYLFGILIGLGGAMILGWHP